MQKIKTLLFLLLCTYTPGAKAQESMIPSVSYTFLDQLIATAKVNYPRMKTFNQRVIMAETGIKKAKLTWFDLLSFSFLYSPNNSTTLVNPSILNGYQVGVFINFGSLFQKPAGIKLAQSELEIAKAEKEEYNLNIEAQVKQAYYLYIQHLSLLKLRSTSAVDAEGTMKQSKYRFEKGEETFQNYNNILMSYTDHLQSKIEAEASLLIAKSNLEELLGKKLEEVK